MLKVTLVLSGIRGLKLTSAGLHRAKQIAVSNQILLNVTSINCKTFFLPVNFVAFHSSSSCLDVHEALKPALVRVTGAAVEKEFAQFVFSLLLEILDACLVSAAFTVAV